MLERVSSWDVQGADAWMLPGGLHTRLVPRGGGGGEVGGVNQACRIDVTTRLFSLHNRNSVRRTRSAVARRKTQRRNARHTRETRETSAKRETQARNA